MVRNPPLAAFDGEVIYPDNSGFRDHIALWNGAIKETPAAVAVPKTIADIQKAIRWASGQQLPLSVLGGGHDWAGRALNNNGIVISMRNFKNIAIDINRQIAVVEGGVIGKELAFAAAEKGLVAVTGTVGAVGFTGFTLGGGYGLLSPSYGLSIDNVVGVDLVLPDGRAVHANEQQHPELFWALKGGGGNFGVVTALHVRLHPARPVLAGMLLFTWDQAETVLSKYSEFMKTVPDQLSVLAGMLPGPDGTPTLFFIPCWNGDPATGKIYIDRLRSLGVPFLDQIGEMECKDMLGMFDPYIVNGNYYTVETRWLPELTPKQASILKQAALTRSSPLTAINMHHMHGAPTRRPLESSAFGTRAPHFLMEIITVWSPEEADNSSLHTQWGIDLSAALAENALPGGYPNLLGRHSTHQIQKAFGSNWPRLKKVKEQYDPGRLFNGIGLPL